jgi:hypothetical protein
LLEHLNRNNLRRTTTVPLVGESEEKYVIMTGSTKKELLTKREHATPTRGLIPRLSFIASAEHFATEFDRVTKE